MATAHTTLMDHLRELRYRLIWSVGVVGIGAAAAYLFRAPIIRFLQRPLHEPLYYTSPTGSFEFVMQVCLLVGFLVALPVVIYNALRFIEPALPLRFSSRQLLLVVGGSFGLAIGGASFGYYISLPAAFRFFGSVGTSNLHALISVDQYFRFVVAYLGTFALIFQLPLVLLLIDHIRPMGPRQLRRGRKLVVVGAFAIAIITPSAPDPLSQVILALPMIVLYEATILTLALRHHRRQKRPQPSAPAKVDAQPLLTQLAKTATRWERSGGRVVPDMPIGPPFYRPRSLPAASQISMRSKPTANGALDLRGVMGSGGHPKLRHALDLRNVST